MACGALKDAAVWLDRGIATAADPGIAAILRLEGAHLAVLSWMDLEAALTTASKITAQATDLGPGDTAELRWLQLRIQLMAAIHRELPREHINRIDTDLAQTVDELFAAGRDHAALSAAYTLADRRTPLAAALAAFDALIAKAHTHGRFGLAGEAALRRAELLRQSGAEEATIKAEIRRAQTLFGAIDHIHGPIDCVRARADLAIDRHGAALDELAHCAQAYLDHGFVRGAISTFMDLSTHAHRRGDSVAAEHYGTTLGELAKAAGMGMERLIGTMREADLAMRRGLYSVARDWCDAALAQQPLRFHEAGLLVLRSTARSMAGDRAGAIADKRMGLAIYEAMQADDLATDIIPSLASDIAETRTADDVAEADHLLRDWIGRDRTAGRTDGAVAKMEVRIDLRALRVMDLRARNDPAAVAGVVEDLLGEAQHLIEEASELADTELSGAVWAQRLSNLAQRRGTIASLRNDEQGLESALRDALQRLDQAGYHFEAANTRYLLGCHLLNQTNAAEGTTKVESFGQAEQLLTDALAFYEGAGRMRRFAANTKHKLALLWLNVLHLVAEPERRQMCNAVAKILLDAAANMDALRRAFRAADALEARSGKATLAADAAQLTRQALRLHLLLERDIAAAWSWVAGSKSRALNDLIGSEAEMPRNLDAQLAEDPVLAGLVSEERALSERLSEATASERLALSRSLDTVHQRMREHPALQDYVELRSGALADGQDLTAAFADAPAGAAFVDWATVGDRLWIFVARPGAAPVTEAITIAPSAVQSFVADYLSPLSFRSTLHRDPDALAALMPLVAPLTWLTHPGEHLICCPTGPLHAVPLHALSCDGGPLLARNPIAYAPSLGVFRLCRLRSDAIDPQGAVVIGDPTEDRLAAQSLSRHLAAILHARLLLGSQASVASLEQALATAALVHFQGHAKHEHAEPLASHLMLAGGARLEARRLFGPPRIQTRMVVLGACESAASVYAMGDELLGLMPAFLVAGARAIVAAQWPVQDSSAADLMSIFYQGLTNGLAPIEALRAAALEISRSSVFATPYHWAPFALYGDPWRNLQPKDNTP